MSKNQILETQDRLECLKERWNKCTPTLGMIFCCVLRHGFINSEPKPRQKEYRYKTDRYKAEINHFWDYIECEHPYLQSVNFIRNNNEYASKQSNFKGIIWCNLSLVLPEDLEFVFGSIFKDENYRLLYNPLVAFIWLTDQLKLCKAL